MTRKPEDIKKYVLLLLRRERVRAQLTQIEIDMTGVAVAAGWTTPEQAAQDCWGVRNLDDVLPPFTKTIES